MAFAQYSKACKDDVEEAKWSKALALTTFLNIEKRKDNPKGQYNKNISTTRSFKSLAVPMIDINLCLEMCEALTPEELAAELPDMDARIESDLEQVMQFYDKEHGLLRENIGEDMDTFEGRLINPGHSIECLWFIMDLLNKRKDTLFNNSDNKQGKHESTMKWALATLKKTLEYGWDKEYGGIFYFMDILGKPTQQLEG